VNRIVHLIETLPEEAWCRHVNTESSSTSLENTSSSATSLITNTDSSTIYKVGPDSLISLVRSGYQYEQSYFPVIQQVLTAAGWDLNKYLFGDIRQRVEW